MPNKADTFWPPLADKNKLKKVKSTPNFKITMDRPSFVDPRKGPNEHRFELIPKTSEALSQYQRSTSVDFQTLVSREEKPLEFKQQSPKSVSY